MKQYEFDITKWLKSLENNFNLHFSEMEKAGKDSLTAMEKNNTQNQKVSGETKVLRRDFDTIKRNIATISEKINHYNGMKNKWIDIKNKYQKN